MTAASPTGRFQPGQSGNPAGRPPGSRNRLTLLRDAALAERAAGLIEGLLQKAEAGDLAATRLVLAQLLPADSGPGIELPAVETEGEIATALGRVAAAIASGELAPTQANALTRALRIQLEARKAEQLRHEKLAEQRRQQWLAEALHGGGRRSPAAEAKKSEEQAKTGSPACTAPPDAGCRNALLPMAEWLRRSGMAGQLARRPPRDPVSASAPGPENRGSRH